jgi:hypothetical protein
VNCDSCSGVVPKLYRLSGAISPVVWFLGLVSIQKTRRALAFVFLSSSNRNRGKVFVVVSKKITGYSLAFPLICP